MLFLIVLSRQILWSSKIDLTKKELANFLFLTNVSKASKKNLKYLRHQQQQKNMQLVSKRNFTFGILRHPFPRF